MHINDEIFLKAGLPSAEFLAKYFERSVKTTRRWRQTGDVPREVGLILEILAGRMPWPGFEGYRCVNYHIVPPGHPVGVPASELKAYEWRLQELRLVKQQLKELTAAPCQFLLPLPSDDGETVYRWQRY